jgi:uncharacterized lipoprotein YbaY
MKRRFWLMPIALLVSVILAACGGTVAQEPTATAEPTARPTSTPRPQPTAAPTREPTPEPTEEQIEVPIGNDDWKTLPISMDDIDTYTYDTGIFSVDIPSAWDVQDRSTDTEVLVRFTDATGNGVVLVNIIEMPEPQGEEQLTNLLNTYLDNTYSVQPEYSRDDAIPQPDGSVLVVWGYDVDFRGEPVRLLGNTFIEQRDNLVSLMTIALPDEQFDTLREDINTVLNSYYIDTSVPVTPVALDGLLPVEIGDLDTYTYDTGLFSIDVPDNWSIKDNSKPGEAIVLWTDPTGNALLVIDVFAGNGTRSQEELVDILETFLENSFGNEEDFIIEDPKPQSDGSTLIVWSYVAMATGGVKAELLGNSFIEQRGDLISIMTTTVPRDQFQELLPHTNEIINSYRLDPNGILP